MSKKEIEVIREDLNGEKLEYSHNDGDFILSYKNIQVVVSARYGYVDVTEKDDKGEEKRKFYTEW